MVASVTSVVSLWRYPVKSMMGEELNSADITEQGLYGDRAYAITESATGTVASAKDPKKWGRLFRCRAMLVDPPRPGAPVPPVRIMLPDGTYVTSTSRHASHLLSRVLGREVSISKAPRMVSDENPDAQGIGRLGQPSDVHGWSGGFFDSAPLHLLLTATLERLQALYPKGRFEVQRFRPNIVVEGDRDLVETSWLGQTLVVGESVRLKVVRPCARCVMTTLSQADLPRDPGILKTAVELTKRLTPGIHAGSSANVGVYAIVVRGGKIRRGDEVRKE